MSGLWGSGTHGGDIELGHSHSLRFTQWSPDRALNPQYHNIPDEPRLGATVYHLKPDGSQCVGGVMFECDVARRLFPNNPRWTVESWEPLTLSPSLLCHCGDHGFIREGKWVPA